MKRVCLLACFAVLGGCMHSAPEVKKESAVPPPPAAKQEKPELSAALVEKSIIKGKTTREEVAAKLGPPNSVVKHPYHAPKINSPNFKLEIPPDMLAVETWNYWKILRDATTSPKVEPMRVLFVKIYIDETGVAAGYEINEKDVAPQ